MLDNRNAVLRTLGANVFGPITVDPEVFYKYRSLDVNTLETLRSNKVWFATRASLNDPFDGYPEIEWPIEDSDIDEFLRLTGSSCDGLSFLEKNELASDNLDDRLNRTGVFCVSTRSDEELMWAHYADNHRGLVIGYKPDKNNYCDLTAIHRTPFVVKYDGPSKIIKTQLLVLAQLYLHGYHPPMLPQLVTAFFCRKKQAWAYESEYRFLSIDGCGLFDLKAPIVSVTYGLRFEDRRRELVRAQLPKEVVEYRICRDGQDLVQIPLCK